MRWCHEHHQSLRVFVSLSREGRVEASFLILVQACVTGRVAFVV